MVNDLLRRIEEAIKEFFADSLIASLERLTGNINDTVMNIGTEVARGPQEWSPEIFSLVRTLSDTVILPLAGIVITYVLVYELYHMVVENNNMKAFEPTDMVKFLIKAFLAVFILSHTFDIALAIFDVAGHVVASAVSVINESTAMDIGDFSHLRAELMDMPLFEVVAMWVEVQFVSVMVWVISIVIMVILFGRMLEIYIYISIAPLPFAAFGNKELSSMSQNYVKGLLAVAFQAFFIMVVVGIYARLITTIGTSGDVNQTMSELKRKTLYIEIGDLTKKLAGAKKRFTALESKVKGMEGAVASKKRLDAIRPEPGMMGTIKGLSLEDVQSLKKTAMEYYLLTDKVKDLSVKYVNLKSKVPTEAEKLETAKKLAAIGQLEKDKAQLCGIIGLVRMDIKLAGRSKWNSEFVSRAGK